MPASPNPLNYMIGKGVLKWKGADDLSYRDLGNAPEFELMPKITRLDHYSSRLGINFKDRSVVRQKEMACRFILEEWTPENLAMFFMGSFSPPSDPDPYSIVDLMNVDEVIGSVRLVGTNDIGTKIQVNIPALNLGPTAGIQFIGDAWGRMEITGEVTGDPETGQFGTIFHGITEEVEV